MLRKTILGSGDENKFLQNPVVSELHSEHYERGTRRKSSEFPAEGEFVTFFAPVVYSNSRGVIQRQKYSGRKGSAK